MIRKLLDMFGFIFALVVAGAAGGVAGAYFLHAVGTTACGAGTACASIAWVNPGDNSQANACLKDSEFKQIYRLATILVGNRTPKLPAPPQMTPGGCTTIADAVAFVCKSLAGGLAGVDQCAYVDLKNQN